MSENTEYSYLGTYSLTRTSRWTLVGFVEGREGAFIKAAGADKDHVTSSKQLVFGDFEAL